MIAGQNHLPKDKVGRISILDLKNSKRIHRAESESNMASKSLTAVLKLRHPPARSKLKHEPSDQKAKSRNTDLSMNEYVTSITYGV
jgi:hypothetical protein